MVSLLLLHSSRKSSAALLALVTVVLGTSLLVLFGTVSNSSSIRILSAHASTMGDSTSTASSTTKPPVRKLHQQDIIQHLVRGDLPEYVPTRKAMDTSKAHLYSITAAAAVVAVAGTSPEYSPVLHPWSVTVSCNNNNNIINKECAHDNPHFFMRAYGASITTGQRQRTYQGKGGITYHEFTFLPTDLGLYTVELFMTFSDAPEFTAFPLPSSEQEPQFEGIMLPGFPVRMLSHNTVPVKLQEPDHECTQADVAWPFPYSPETMPVARWKLISKSESKPARPAATTTTATTTSSTTTTTATTATKEQTNIAVLPSNMMLKMEYQHIDCNSPTNDQIRAGLYKMVRESEKPIRLILFGDSLMNLQEKAYRKMAEGIPGIRVTSFNGPDDRHTNKNVYPDAFAELLKLEEHRVVVFNYSGLYHSSCSQTNKKTAAGKEQPCGELYRSRLYELLKTLHMFPADLKIFQTMAGPDRAATLPSFSTSLEMVGYFNQIALETVREFDSDSFVVVDGYYTSSMLTASQPALSDHPEGVVSALTREWVTIFINAMKEGGNLKLAVIRNGIRSISTPGRVAW
jgi:hypothetical protein